MSRDNWARLVEAVVRRERIWQMFHDHSRSPSISTIASEDDSTSNSTAEITNDRLKALSVSSPVLERNPVGKKVVSTGLFSQKLFSSWYRRWKPKDYPSVDIPIPEIDVGDDVWRFSISELEAATDNFNRKNLIGREGYHYVYKGRLADGSRVAAAIKRFKGGTYEKAVVQFQTEVQILSHTALHPNIIRLLGYCITPKDRMLVLPLMVNGSVASCLRERSESQIPLNWSTRRRIALGTAKGLAYLHGKCDPKVIHRDVKAANILLDEDFEAVVVDFESAKLMEHSDVDVDTAVRGTFGHIAPEYLNTGKLTEKTDIFAYGVFLLELITGQCAFDLARHANDDDVMVRDWVKKHLLEKKWSIIMDPDCNDTDLMEEEVEQLIQLALICTQTNPEGRPKMSEIVMMLDVDGDGLVERWEQWLKEEMLQNSSPEIDRVSSDDTLNIPPDELSGPR